MASEEPRKRRWGATEKKISGPSRKKPPWHVEPTELLLQHERNKNASTCRELIKLLQTKNGEPEVARHLWQMVREHDSEAAAMALQGRCHEDTKSSIIRTMTLGLDGGALLRHGDSFASSLRSSHWYQFALYKGGSTTLEYISPCTPLALGGTTEPTEVALLLRAARYRTEIDHFDHVEKLFRSQAAAALTYDDQTLVRLVRLMLGTWDDLVYESARIGFCNASFEQRTKWKTFADLSNQRAAYRAARTLLHKNAFSAFLRTIRPSRRYRRFISDIKHLAKTTS